MKRLQLPIPVLVLIIFLFIALSVGSFILGKATCNDTQTNNVDTTFIPLSEANMDIQSGYIYYLAAGPYDEDFILISKNTEKYKLEFANSNYKGFLDGIDEIDEIDIRDVATGYPIKIAQIDTTESVDNFAIGDDRNNFYLALSSTGVDNNSNIRILKYNFISKNTEELYNKTQLNQKNVRVSNFKVLQDQYLVWSMTDWSLSDSLLRPSIVNILNILTSNSKTVTMYDEPGFRYGNFRISENKLKANKLTTMNDPKASIAGELLLRYWGELLEIDLP